ncbi:MAG: hypothetical protein ACXVCY_12185 [Pseudobdellovibrionaceae bacterium]
MDSKSHKEIVNEIISILRKNQEALQIQIESDVDEYRDTSDEMSLYGLFRAFAYNPEKTNWSELMLNIESILNNPSLKEHSVFVEQYILEGFSNVISNNAFDPKWIKDCIGPKALEYIKAYDKFMKAKPTF